MADRTPVEVLNAHHDKLNEHTQQIKILQERIDRLTAAGEDTTNRIDKLQKEHEPMFDFVRQMQEWVIQLTPWK